MKEGVQDDEILIYLTDKEFGAYVITEEFTVEKGALGITIECIDIEGYVNVIPLRSVDRIKYKKTADIVKVCGNDDNDNKKVKGAI